MTKQIAELDEAALSAIAPERIWMIGSWPNATFACLAGNLDEVEFVRADIVDSLRAEVERLTVLTNLRPLSEWHEDKNPFALWWAVPIDEPPYCGSPNDDNWPGYHTHWTPIPLPKLDG